MNRKEKVFKQVRERGESSAMEISKALGFQASGHLTTLKKQGRIYNENEWRISRHLGFETSFSFNQIDISPGEFEVLVGSAGFRVTPNPKLSWNTLVQWDSVSNRVGINSRIRWIVKPGNDIFIVFNQGLEYTDDRSFRSLGSDFTTKLGWTFRY